MCKMLLSLIGFLSGIVSGMGIGGGAILIPALVIFVNPEQHIAQSVNLLFFIPTALMALVIHIRNKRIDLKMALLNSGSDEQILKLFTKAIETKPGRHQMQEGWGSENSRKMYQIGG
jgi:hypothetical protein